MSPTINMSLVPRRKPSPHGPTSEPSSPAVGPGLHHALSLHATSFNDPRATPARRHIRAESADALDVFCNLIKNRDNLIKSTTELVTPDRRFDQHQPDEKRPTDDELESQSHCIKKSQWQMTSERIVLQV